MYFAPVPSPGDTAEGSVIEISEKALAHIDTYETYAYVRVSVTLGSGSNAWVYVKNEKQNIK